MNCTISAIPTPDELDDNPELAVLSALDANLMAARSALLAAWGELRSGNGLDQELPAHPAVWLAAQLIADADAMSESLVRYRTALQVSAFSTLHCTRARDD